MQTGLLYSGVEGAALRCRWLPVYEPANGEQNNDAFDEQRGEAEPLKPIADILAVITG